jgi:signal transduction histidine kinase
MESSMSFRGFIILFIPLLLVLAAVVNIFSFQLKIFSLGFYGFLFIYLAYIRLAKKTYTYPLIIILLLILALYTVGFVTVISAQKEHETKKVLALNLANERDQIAEMLLEGLEEKIENDSIVRDLLTWHLQNEGAIKEHLQMNYFSGYFRKYDLQISVCNPNDDLTLLLENSTEIVHCYSFFDDLFENDGMKLQNSRFFFLENEAGKIRYLGRFVYKKKDWTNEVSLFVYIDSKLISQELGYPELLLDSKMNGSSVLNDYSYAKYREKDLITRSGEFSYQLTIPEQWETGREFYFSTDNRYDHLVYTFDESTQIVITNRKVRFIDALASFSYIFVFYYILYTLVVFGMKFPHNIREFNYDFKNKIKFSMIGVLLLSLIIVGFGTIFYNVNQFERNLYERIGEKIQSVRTEMEHKLGGDFELTSDDYDYLNYLLIKFSGVFNIDINLYDAEGNLLASSQSQIFEKGLMGNKMDTEAYKQLVANKRGQYIHKESIGGLSYYSAYVPFLNDENKLLAYINLPYFTKQSELRKEIYTVVVAVVNIYFFLILISVIVAVFVSNNITKPLELIQERFRAIDLGKQNEPIAYTSHDEIGSLIKEYNRMVSELTENAEKLAKSERESAWREMAKQIAHEIKNPLTPMKLSVQYLQKAWKDDIPDFDKRLEKFSNSLISQINNLSSIATEFSNFAKMPRARAEQVDIVAKLNETINLFENTENVTFYTDFDKIKELFVFADKEQVLIVFSNLIQNGIQAVPKGRNAEIKIGLQLINDYVKISIRDNGKGIPDELKEKLFIPNFTTKSSGMGLGLAIVRNIVVNAGGEIWYETQVDQPDENKEGGTTFHVTFPIYKATE